MTHPDSQFRLELNEAICLLVQLNNEFIKREPIEHYETIIRLLKALNEFVDDAGYKEEYDHNNG